MSEVLEAPTAAITSSSVGDPLRFRSYEALVEAFAGLAPSPTDRGRLTCLVTRGDEGLRSCPRRALLTVDGGLPGDAWGRHPARKADEQLAVMEARVAALVANGQPLGLFGDNLFVDLDLSVANLPVGSRLRVGEALVEVTPEPHDGCRKFLSRFGAGALRFTARPETRGLNLRGIYWRVVEPGVVEVGDAVEVVSRGPSGR